MRATTRHHRWRSRSVPIAYIQTDSPPMVEEPGRAEERRDRNPVSSDEWRRSQLEFFAWRSRRFRDARPQPIAYPYLVSDSSFHQTGRIK
jgi:hypothetical protein